MHCRRMLHNLECHVILFCVFIGRLQEKLLGHLGVVLYEYLGEEYPEVLGSILGGLKVRISLSLTPSTYPLAPSLPPSLPPSLTHSLTPPSSLSNSHAVFLLTQAIVNVIGMTKMTPPIKDLLPRLTPILKNR